MMATTTQRCRKTNRERLAIVLDVEKHLANGKSLKLIAALHGVQTGRDVNKLNSAKAKILYQWSCVLSIKES